MESKKIDSSDYLYFLGALFVDKNLVNKKYEALNMERKDAFMAFFKEKGVEKQVVFSKTENLIPYNSVVALGDFVVVAEEEII